MFEEALRRAAKAVCGAVYTDGIDADLDWRSKRDREACEKVARAAILAFQKGAPEVEFANPAAVSKSGWCRLSIVPPKGTYVLLPKREEKQDV